MLHQFLVALLLTIFVCASHQAGQTQLNSSCKATEDCGSNAFCTGKSHQCKCINTYSPQSDNINCQPLSCSKDSECKAKYDAHSVCNINVITNSGKTCQCGSGWTFDVDTTLNTCVPQKVLLNHSCKDKTDCGTNAYCDLTKTCKCNFGFKPDLKNEINCALINCQSDADCAQSGAHAQCDSKSCGCNYKAGYVLDYDQNRCVPRYPFTGQDCDSKTSCGPNAICDMSTNGAKTGTCACSPDFVPNPHQMNSNILSCVPRHQFIGKSCSRSSNFTCGTEAFCDLANTTLCKCKFGFFPKANQMDCTQYCTSDAQCEQSSPNTKCYESQNCYCKHGYKLDLVRQVCVTSSAVVVWSNLTFLFMIIMCCKMLL